MSQIDEQLRTELQRQGVWVTSMQDLYNWGRKNSIWPLQFGLACCAIEMIATAASATTSRASVAKCSVRHRGRRI